MNNNKLDSALLIITCLEKDNIINENTSRL